MTKQGSITRIKERVGIANRLYKNRLCGLPNGVTMPPRLAARFCSKKVMAAYSVCPAAVSTARLSGRKVSSAMSLASSIEPVKVTATSATTQRRSVCSRMTIASASERKKRMPRRAHTAASVLNRQASVRQSKYPA